MSDGQLFDAPPVTISALSGKPVRARATDPASSHQAAEAASRNAHTIRALVLIALDDLGQATADKVRDHLRAKGHAIKDSSPRSRLRDLREEDTPYVRIVRRTAENQAVYTVTDRGRTAANDLRAAQGQEAA